MGEGGMTLAPDIIAFRRVRKGGTEGQPWEGPEGTIYLDASES